MHIVPTNPLAVFSSSFPDLKDIGEIFPIKLYANTALRLGGSVYL